MTKKNIEIFLLIADWFFGFVLLLVAYLYDEQFGHIIQGIFAGITDFFVYDGKTPINVIVFLSPFIMLIEVIVFSFFLMLAIVVFVLVPHNCLACVLNFLIKQQEGNVNRY